MTLERKPPRRDPRILALVPVRSAIAYATADAWEVTGTGAIPVADVDGLRLALRRLLIQTRPTVVVCAPAIGDAQAGIVQAIATHSGIPTVLLDRRLARDLLDRAPTLNVLQAQYPELRTLDVRDGFEAVRLAAAALSSLPLPSPNLCSNPLSSLPRLRGCRSFSKHSRSATCSRVRSSRSSSDDLAPSSTRSWPTSSLGATSVNSSAT